MEGVTWTFYGPDAILLRFDVGRDSRSKLVAMSARLEELPPRGLREFVHGFASLLLIFDSSARKTLAARAPAIVADLARAKTPPQGKPRVFEIPVRYTGEDLEWVAQQTGLSVDQVIKLHSRPLYTVALLGFSPGFPYLAPLHKRLQLPRRPEPRPRVLAGSVGIGGEHTGIYTIPSPGGWHILGQTDVQLFNPAVAGPFLLRAGDRVKFKPIGVGQ